MIGNTTANKITAARIMLVPVFLILAYSGFNLAACILYVILSVSDFADGYIARKYNQESVFGKFLDPLADKIMVVSAMCYFTQFQRIPGWALALVCFREFAVSGLRMVAANKSKVIAADFSGKIKTAVSMTGLSLMLAFDNKYIDIIVVILILVTTIFSGIEYFIKNKYVLYEDKK